MNMLCGTNSKHVIESGEKIDTQHMNAKFFHEKIVKKKLIGFCLMHLLFLPI